MMIITSNDVYSIFPGGIQYAFADKNETNFSKTGALYLDLEDSQNQKIFSDDIKKEIYLEKNINNLHNKSIKENDSSWPSFEYLLSQMNTTKKIHHYKHHHKHRWWLHAIHHLEKVKAKVRLKENDAKTLQEQRFQNFVFRKEKVSDKTYPVLVISEKKVIKQQNYKQENKGKLIHFI